MKKVVFFCMEFFCVYRYLSPLIIVASQSCTSFFNQFVILWHQRVNRMGLCWIFKFCSWYAFNQFVQMYLCKNLSYPYEVITMAVSPYSIRLDHNNMLQITVRTTETNDRILMGAFDVNARSMFLKPLVVSTNASLGFRVTLLLTVLSL